MPMATRSVRALDLPLEMPFRIAYDTVSQAHNVLLTLDGAAFGEGAPQKAVTGETQAQVLRDLAGPSPRTAAGRCAADTAAWDAQARRDGVPLCTALTGARPQDVETSITIPLVADEELVPLVQRRLAEGFSSFKVKAGREIREDLARLERVRDAIGARELRVDANQGWSLGATMRALPELAGLDVAMLEQPLGREDLVGHSALRRASARVSGPPIMLDESVFTAQDAQGALAAGAADWINIKLQKSGGLTEALRIADLAAEQDVPCMVGCMLESRIGVLHGAHFAAAHANVRKADLDGALLLRDDPVQGGGRYEAGRILLGSEAGIGVEGVTLAAAPA